MISAVFPGGHQGTAVALSAFMLRDPGIGVGVSLEDGLGIRVRESATVGGSIEVLHLEPGLATQPGLEPAVRAAAARLAAADAPVAPVTRIDRAGEALRIACEVPRGLRLSELLADLEAGRETLSDAGVLEIALAAAAALASLHQMPGTRAHGAVTSAHAVLTAEGRIVLTDGVFGAAFEALQLNREQLWRQFGLALPASASLPRFDQRSDVTGLGALVLALVLRRPLGAGEYPRGVADVVLSATAGVGEQHASALNMWLQQALQLHPRAVFGSAVGAERALAEIASGTGVRRAGSREVARVLAKRGLRAAAEPASLEHQPAEPRSRPRFTPARPEPERSPSTFLRSVFSNLRPS